MRKLILPFLILLYSICGAQQLSDSARISLLTVAPGNELYSAFGHSGIRITDYKQGFDVVFNYGTFNFNQPNFYVNFVKGRLLYMVNVESFRNFMGMYVYEERGVVEDELNLTTEEKQRIFAFLANNIKPENRDYRYEFFFDNCATRIRDVFEKELGGKLQFDYTGYDTTLTLRQMLDIYVDNSPWVKFGFYLILGMPCDINATPRIQTFLPDYLQKSFKQAQLYDGKERQAFVTSSKVLLDYPLPQPEHSLFTPLNVMVVLFGFYFILNLIEANRKKKLWFFDVLLFGVAGLLGCFFLGMWLFTEHYSVPKNLNMLWACPLFLPLAILLAFKSQRQKPYMAKAFLGVTLLTAFAALFKFVLPQPLHPAVVVIASTLALRAFWIYSFLKKGAA